MRIKHEHMQEQKCNITLNGTSPRRNKTFESMKKEYDFSKGERGKFYRPNIRLKLPIYLDDDIAEFIEKYAEQKRVDVQTVVNEILRHNKEMLQALHR